MIAVFHDQRVVATISVNDRRLISAAFLEAVADEVLLRRQEIVSVPCDEIWIICQILGRVE
jgi:hypothetical protein